MPAVINLRDATKRRALSSRGTARSIEPVINDALTHWNGNGSLTVDLERMAVVTPSFFDELLHVIKDSAPPDSLHVPEIHLTNTSDHQFRRFRAVCRAHGMTTEKVGPNHYRLSKA